MSSSVQQFIQTLNDATRLRCLQLLQREGEMCVCEITYALDVIQPKVSRHLAILKENEIVIDRRSGQWIYYKLNPAMPEWVSKILAATCDGVSNEPRFKADRTRLAHMPNRPVNSICA